MDIWKALLSVTYVRGRENFTCATNLIHPSLFYMKYRQLEGHRLFENYNVQEGKFGNSVWQKFFYLCDLNNSC